MPIYQYKCDICGKDFEHIVITRDDDAPYCPDCGSSQLLKQATTHATFSIKGDNSCSQPKRMKK